MKWIFVAIALTCFVGLGECGRRIDIILSGRDIPSNDIVWGETEPYVKVFFKFDNGQNWVSFGQTTTSKGNPNPDWPQVFTFDYTGGNAQVRFDLHDKDVIWDDYMGGVELSLGAIVSAAESEGGMAVVRNFDPTRVGKLVMKVRIDGVIP